MKLIVFLACCLYVLGSASATNWAVLVAGSNEYYNYRHQSDVCHAYQILTQKGGFPAENVIVMMYDDIAYNSQNPFPGTIINKPNGTNVYPGVNKDYVGNNVTPQNFLHVLSGNADAMKGIGSGKVVNSNSEDNIFVYFTDHGAPGLVAFPSGGYLYAKDFVATIKSMHQNNRYKKMVIYIEACESGSMFEGLLPTDINVFATTASTADESSYAWYYDDSRRTYLGDEYSVRWMEDSDVADFNVETLQEQFDKVKKATTMSHPQQYGDNSLANDKLGEYQSFGKFASNGLPFYPRPVTPSTGASNCRDCKLDILERQYLAARVPEEKERLGELYKHELTMRATVDATIRMIVKKVMNTHSEAVIFDYTSPRDFDCLKESMSIFEKRCGSFNDYSLKYVRTLVNMCELGVSTQKLTQAVTEVCPIQY